MTKEEKEKANYLAIRLEGEIGTSPHSLQSIEEALIEMGAWKEREVIERAINFIKANTHDFYDGFHYGEYMISNGLISQDSFIKNFRKALERGEE